jgi:hypothetical protein
VRLTVRTSRRDVRREIMQSFWVSVSYDKELVLSNCFNTNTREEAVELMMEYLRLEFELPESVHVNINHH